MKHTKQEVWPITQILIFWTMILVIMTILKSASDLLVPFLIAIALAIVLSPLLTYLESKRIPKILSLVFIVLIALVPSIILGGYIGEEVKEFANNFQTIKQQFFASLESIHYL